MMRKNDKIQKFSFLLKLYGGDIFGISEAKTDAPGRLTLDRFVQKSKKIMFSGPTSFNMIQTFIFGIRNEEEYLYAYFHNQKRRLKRRLVVPGVRKPSQKLSKF